jgi:predicted ABC-type ATPase
LFSPEQRRAAQARWVNGVFRIEEETTAALLALLSPARAASLERSREFIARGDIAGLGSIAAQIRADYLTIDREAAARSLARGMERAYAFGEDEGEKRVRVVRKRVRKTRARPNLLPQADQQVQEWTAKTADNSARVAQRSITQDLLIGSASTAVSLLRGDRYRSSLLSRNMVTGSGRSGIAGSFDANGVEAWTWIAGPNACEVCWGKTGLVFPASQPFESHVNCRCSQEPAPGGLLDAGGLGLQPQSFDADVAFSRLPEARQVKILGRGKHNLWRSKSISLRDIPDGTKAKPIRRLVRKNMGDIPVPVKDLAAPPRGMRLRRASASKYLRPDGTISPARQRLHDQIVEEYLAGKTSQASPQMLMLGGGPASGKSSVLRSGKFTTKALSGDDVVTINSDDIKERLLAHIPKKIREGKNWAAYTHEESSYLSKRIIAAAVERRVNVVVDAVGSSVGGTLARISTVKQAGYRVSGLYVSIPVEEAISRAAIRAAKSGRLVQNAVIAEGHVGVSRAFSQVYGAFDDFLLLDNSQAQGLPATVIARFSRGRLAISDRSLYDAFVRKGSMRLGSLR